MRQNCRKALCIFIVTLGLFTSVSCLFETRQPEPPTSDPITWQTPSDSPLTVLANLGTAINRHENSYEYLLSFAADFNHVPSEYDRNAFEETFNIPWSKNREEQFASNLFSALQPADIVDLHFNRTESEDIINDLAGTAVLYRQYEIIIPKNRTGFLQDNIQGIARIDLWINSEGYWVIRRWEDAKFAADIPDWGQLRHRFK